MARSKFLIVDHRTEEPRFRNCDTLDEANAAFLDARRASRNWMTGGSLTLLEIGEASCAIVDQVTDAHLQGAPQNKWVQSF